ncbi:ribbon-helix-helix protein, CopG family [Pseudomonas sp. A014]|uniref:ribbon-helix-helix protein, CopG family n=1 Tax=Pseudomonas sp. A014 TaxID=3458058 RepID=UPI00403635FE
MNSSTAGIKLDSMTKERIRKAAASLDRTPHWFMKKAVLHWLEKVEGGSSVEDMSPACDLDADEYLNSVSSRQKLAEQM